LLNSLELQSRIPDLIVVVDSSDTESNIKAFQKTLNITYIHTNIQSAAKQRNLGMNFVATSFQGDYLISFLDDDVLVPTNYIESHSVYLKDYAEVVGVSGVTTPQPRVTSLITRIPSWLGFTGNPGTLTRAIINMAPPISGEPVKVEWLIGCSTWNIGLIKELRFEEDFFGNSLFEDVIFSYQAASLGDLVCIPELKIQHSLSEVGRDSSKRHYYFWVLNRFRIFRYSRGDFSKVLFFMNSGLLALYFAALSLRNVEGNREKFIGITSGLFDLMRGKRNN
jgi:GT2 family glycosyltransferase